MGDRLLKEISARLLRCIRSRDYAFRIGGDEFALIVSADMDEEQRGRMAERIQDYALCAHRYRRKTAFGRRQLRLRLLSGGR